MFDRPRKLYGNNAIGAGMSTNLEPQLGGTEVPPFGAFHRNTLAVERPGPGTHIFEIFRLRKADPNHGELRRGASADHWTMDNFHLLMPDRGGTLFADQFKIFKTRQVE